MEPVVPSLPEGFVAVPDMPHELMGQRIGFVDAGSVMIKVLLIEAVTGGFYAPPAMRYPARLGEKKAKDGHLDPQALEYLWRTFDEIALIGAKNQIGAWAVAATSAIRGAPSDQQALFIQQAVRRFGPDVRILTGEEEAGLTFQGVSVHPDYQTGPIGVPEVGGGSMQVSWGENGKLEGATSDPYGWLVIQEKYGLKAPIRETALESKLAAVKTDVRKAIGNCPLAGRTFVGVGGVFRILAKSLSTIARRALPASGGASVSYDELREFTKWAATLPPGELAPQLGLKDRQGDCLLPGVAMVRGILEELNLDRISSCEHHLRIGMAVDWLRRQAPGSNGAKGFTPE